jgi:hypothetical protein
MRGEAETTANKGARRSHRDENNGLGRREAPVVIELSGIQVEHMARAAATAGNLSLLHSLPGGHAGLAACFQAWRGGGLSNSLLRGLLVLASFPADGSYVRITDLARQCTLSQSTTHRYVSTFLAVGIVERDPRTREYRAPA